jgi:hypothetical protein
MFAMFVGSTLPAESSAVITPVAVVVRSKRPKR